MNQPETPPTLESFPADAPAPALPPLPKRTWLTRAHDYFLGEDPTLLTALVPTCFLSMLLYTRHPATNFIFDEQEALLANPYVRAAADPTTKIGWMEAFRRDFWGLTPDKTIGSYRPLPDLVWRGIWKVLREGRAVAYDCPNLLLHGLNGALLVLLVFKWTRDRRTAWLAGAIFVATAVVTEAVSGVVGLADVLGGAGALLALLSLNLRLTTMPIALLGATLFGLYSKESALCIVPLVPLAALMTAQITHPERPLRWARALVAGLITTIAFVFYVEMRRRGFPVATPPELTVEANIGKPALHRAFVAALRWYAQPMLPHDPLNNPLIDAAPPERVAGALRVFTRGLGQVVFPRTLAGDYSAPQEPIPDRLVFPESVFGALAMVVPLVAAPVIGTASWWRARRGRLAEHFESRRVEGADAQWQEVEMPMLVRQERAIDLGPVVAFALVWVVISFFPVSNIPVVLPTVRAERFWYFPAIGTATVLAILSGKLFAAGRRYNATVAAAGLFGLFFSFQCFAARRHALDYNSDLDFWNATRKSVPRSAKAHLNYSVMLGARGDLEGRLVSNGVALELAPKWPMASVYEGDTLCRLHRAEEAMPHYLRGFGLNPNDMSLIALGLQCLWDEKLITSEDAPARAELEALVDKVADKYPNSWLRYLVDDTFDNGEEYQGVNPKYRPRGYNEGPKKEE